MRDKKVSFNKFSRSQSAINKYMHFKDSNYGLHIARVLISSGGNYRYNEIVKVVVSIETNNSFVEIFSDSQFERDYYIKYTNEYQEFKFFNGTLIIKATDRWGNPIEIDITAV